MSATERETKAVEVCRNGSGQTLAQPHNQTNATTHTTPTPTFLHHYNHPPPCPAHPLTATPFPTHAAATMTNHPKVGLLHSGYYPVLIKNSPPPPRSSGVPSFGCPSNLPPRPWRKKLPAFVKPRLVNNPSRRKKNKFGIIK